MSDDLPAPMPLAEAVAVLNRVGHRGYSDWARLPECWSIVSPQTPRYNNRKPIRLPALEAIAIAEYYVRHGIETWPGWEE